MQLWLIIPVKPLAQGKSRLSSILSNSERYQLSHDLLRQTLTAAVGVEMLAGVIVISRDEEALALASATGATILEEEIHPRKNGDDPEDPLNRALRQARAVAVGQGADAILVLPADLPLLSTREIHHCAQLGADLVCGLIIASSGDGGTNALLVRPPDAIDFAYGPGSFQAHIHKAQVAGLPIHIVESPALALDLDSPADLYAWQETFTTTGRE